MAYFRESSGVGRCRLFCCLDGTANIARKKSKSDLNRKSRRDSPLEIGDRVVFAARKWRGGRCLTEDTPGTIVSIDQYGTATIDIGDGTTKLFTLAQLAYEPSEADIDRRKLIEQQAWSDEERAKRDVRKNPPVELHHWGADRHWRGEHFDTI